MAVPVEGQVSVGGFTVFVEADITRPSNTTQYTANDQVSHVTGTSLLQFKGCARTAGGTGIIYSGVMFDSVDAATNPNFSLVLFDTLDITSVADNSAAAVIDAQVSAVVACITFDGTNSSNVHTIGANLVITATGINQAFRCAPGSRDLYGMVIDRGGYTPAALEQFRFRLGILQD